MLVCMVALFLAGEAFPMSGDIQGLFVLAEIDFVFVAVFGLVE